MRLLNSHSLAIEEYWDANIPPYAILSHTWDHEEVSFQDMQDISIAERRFGFSKLKKAADLAAEDGYDWIWIDTCCKLATCLTTYVVVNEICRHRQN